MADMDGIQAVGREDLLARQQAIQNQLLMRKSASDVPAGDDVEGLEKELDQVSKELTAAPKSYPSALERLKGQRDEYIPSGKGEQTVCDTDQVDKEIQDLKEQVESLEKQAGEAADPAEAERLERELRAAEAQLQAKDNDAYRRQHAEFRPLG